MSAAEIDNKYNEVIKIRVFEELILELFSQNKLSGTTHTYIGQEATAAALMKYVGDKDFVFSNHRCHGHYLAYGGPEQLLLAEIMSRKNGLCQGRGGSQHIRYKNFVTNGIQGGIVPNAVGVALANKLNNNNSNTIVFLGDGTLGQGVVYESANIASVYDIPVVFVVEDNQYAMSTRRDSVIAGDIKARFESFAINAFEIESTDVDELDLFFGNVFAYINETRKPVCAIIHNYRLGAHSKGDDTRDAAEIAEHKKNDPIKLIERRIGLEKVKKIYSDYRNCFEQYVEEEIKEPYIQITVPEPDRIKAHGSFLPSESIRYVDGIRTAFDNRLREDKNAVFIGEDIRDPYGGAFKATKQLSALFDKQVLNMPISEACMVGMSIGLAMNGKLPVTEMMFGDFITLGFDQLLNHASKYGWVYGISLPVVIRVPSGAKRGYGPTHSQSLEKFLVGIPCLKVLALNPAIDPRAFYKQLFNSIKEPTIVIENKKLYGQRTWMIQNARYKDFEVTEVNNYGYPTIKFSIDPVSAPDCYIIVYGGMSEDAVEASYSLMLTDEIQADVIIISQLSPLPVKDLQECIKSRSPVIIVEEGTKTGGIGAELIALLSGHGLGSEYIRVAAPDMPVPNGIALESQMIPDKETIRDAIRARI